MIEAPAYEIWQRLIAATAWPGWYSNAANVVVNDSSALLAEGVSFEWTTFGLEIFSKVAEFVPDARLGWYGRGEGLEAYHLATDPPRARHLHRHGGDRPRRRRKATLAANPGHMHRGHDLWNVSLKFLCETRPHDAPPELVGAVPSPSAVFAGAPMRISFDRSLPPVAETRVERASGQTGPGMRSTLQKRLTLLAMCIERGMILLDITIVNVALPSIGRRLHESSAISSG